MDDDARMHFEGSKAKRTTNLRKHGVSFEEAQTVFYEDSALLVEDPDHSEDEDRFLLLGPSAASRVLIVVHCSREPAEVIRIISARKATRSEQKLFLTAKCKP